MMILWRKPLWHKENFGCSRNICVNLIYDLQKFRYYTVLLHNNQQLWNIHLRNERLAKMTDLGTENLTEDPFVYFVKAGIERCRHYYNTYHEHVAYEVCMVQKQEFDAYSVSCNFDEITSRSNRKIKWNCYEDNRSGSRKPL